MKADVKAERLMIRSSMLFAAAAVFLVVMLAAI